MELSAAALQASFLARPRALHDGLMVWWGHPDPGEAAATAGLPSGTPGHLLLAAPDANGGRPTVARRPVRLVRLDQAVPALSALRPARHTSDSLRSWQAAARLVSTDDRDPVGFARIAATMPPAAHAVAADTEHLWSAETTVAAFVDAVRAVHLADDGTDARLVAARDDTATDIGVAATLRPYQRHGLAWLRAVAEHHRGGLLADDMGLGKTIQSIALLAGRDGTRPHLVVCPTSVVGNWARELHRFAPALPVVRHHGPNRRTVADFPAGGVVVTTYSLLLRDRALLSGVDWDVVILDEAQQIKNHASATAKAARALPAGVRVALTGTPVENRLSELWSIMDFANPGLLGSHSRFTKRFAEPIQARGDARVAARLRKTIAPYLLRRVKNDVATDLPAKQEYTVACSLTAEQARLYRSAVSSAWNDGFGDGIGRHGRILRLLTRLKQICNHPAQYLGQTEPLARRSGKLARATEMLAEAIADGHQSLVFTQYRVMGDLLVDHLRRELGLVSVPFLHGGVAATARESMVDQFRSGDDPPPVLVVSLKAGGTGLNLTAATHVLHYDRWWNPAVEDQATDRAHRIGQTRPVDVHKLVSAGTVEERIAELLERKRSLADAIVGTGEDWITRLDDTRLRELVELSDTEVAE